MPYFDSSFCGFLFEMEIWKTREFSKHFFISFQNKKIVMQCNCISRYSSVQLKHFCVLLSFLQNVSPASIFGYRYAFSSKSWYELKRIILFKKIKNFRGAFWGFVYVQCVRIPTRNTIHMDLGLNPTAQAGIKVPGWAETERRRWSEERKGKLKDPLIEIGANGTECYGSIIWKQANKFHIFPETMWTLPPPLSWSTTVEFSFEAFCAKFSKQENPLKSVWAVSEHMG